MRMPQPEPLADEREGGFLALGSLWFGDGSQKTLAGFIVWLGLLHSWRQHPDLIQHPQVVQLISSLLRMKTTLRGSDSSNVVDSVISRIVKQNSDAKVQPVTSFMWASILLSLGENNSLGTVTYDDMMQRYNDHPEVLAQNTETDDGGINISLDNKRQVAIRNWVERTSPSTWAVVEASQHDMPFNLGPIGETTASFTFLFMGSSVPNLMPDTSCGLSSLDSEPFFTVDWTLPLGPDEQTILFKRILSDFGRQTACVAVASKKKYRATQADLMQLRNLIALWGQLKPHMTTRLPLPDVLAWDASLSKSSSFRDDDLAFILQSRPITLSLSMLPSQKDVAQHEAHEKDQRICLDVETERISVRNARWGFFKAALKRDQHHLVQVKDVPRAIQALTHLKEVEQRSKQSSVGEQSVLTYAEKFLKVVHLPKMEIMQNELSKFVNHVVPNLIPNDADTP
jgi:hypothetical protein